MPVVLEKTTDIKVVKRDGKKVDFDGSKIALAIKKGFDSITLYNEDTDTYEYKYNEKDIQKVYQAVIKIIEKDYPEKIKIEEISYTLTKQAIPKITNNSPVN